MLDLAELAIKKRRGEALCREDIDRWIVAIVRHPKPTDDIKLAALLMAICCRGMTPEETRDLTMAMALSGDCADLSGVGGVCVDKHSTGGVGDTTTLVLTPLCAACGVKVAKMSGRGLGHTGGTLDKLESIPGMRVERTMDEFVRQVREIGCAVVGQSENLTPADRVMYSLRDVTGTVDSLPLIVSSIMSKKIAAGADAIVLDVKTGSGALMQTLPESVALARAMVEVGRLAGRPTHALVTGMDQPLGTHIGNALEVKEAIDILAGRAGGRLLDVSLRLGAMMMVAGGYAADEGAARARLSDALASGAGLAKFKQMIEAQGGDPRVCDDISLLPHTDSTLPVLAEKRGYVARMDTAALGEASRRLGAGRYAKGDPIDPAVGLVMAVELGDFVEPGAPLCHVHAEKGEKADAAIGMIRNAIVITAEKAALPPLVYAAVRPDGAETVS